MLQVIKRSGKQEPFDIEKIKTVILDASDELKQPLNEGDIRTIAKEIQNMVEGKETITSWQLYVILIGIFYAYGFVNMAKAYAQHKSNFWNNK